MPNDIQSGLAFTFEYAQFFTGMGLPAKRKFFAVCLLERHFRTKPRFDILTNCKRLQDDCRQNDFGYRITLTRLINS
jgi:hypothetical protein